MKWWRYGDPLGGAPPPLGTCTVDGCGKPSHTHLYCARHTSRVRKHGDPFFTMKPDDFGLPKIEQFRGRMEVGTVPPDGFAEPCWDWRAGGGGNGYGWFGDGPAHRWSYEYHVGPIPDGLTIDHLCRNRGCVNPTHLEPVTRGENVLRGESIPAQNARKTHCKRGHPFEGDNLRVTAKGRECRACERTMNQARRTKR